MKKPTREDIAALSKPDLIDLCMQQTELMIKQREREGELLVHTSAVTLDLQDLLETNLTKKAYGNGLPSWAETRIAIMVDSGKAYGNTPSEEA